MSMLKPSLVLNAVETYGMPGININGEIFHGDSVFHILFCVTLMPLGKLCNNTGCGYIIYDNTINHLFYMDDSKPFAKNDEQLHSVLNIVKEISNDIRM